MKIKTLPKIALSLASALTLSLLNGATALAENSATAPALLYSGPVSPDKFEFVEGYGATLNSGGVEVDTTAREDEWHEYFRTVPAKISFKPNKTYKISYDYTVTKSGNDKTQFYHLLRSWADKKDVGYEAWVAGTGKSGHREFFADLTASSDFRLTLGVRFQGAIHIENLRIEEMADPTISALPAGVFYSGPILREKRVELLFGAKTVDGGVEVDTTGSSSEWHEFFRTVPAKLKFTPKKSYKIAYDYTVQKVGDGTTEFYHLVRPTENEDTLGWDAWVEPAGSKGHKEFTVELGQATDYKLIIGVHYKGALHIENLKITEQP